MPRPDTISPALVDSIPRRPALVLGQGRGLERQAVFFPAEPAQVLVLALVQELARPVAFSSAGPVPARAPVPRLRVQAPAYLEALANSWGSVALLRGRALPLVELRQVAAFWVAMGRFSLARWPLGRL